MRHSTSLPAASCTAVASPFWLTCARGRASTSALFGCLSLWRYRVRFCSDVLFVLCSRASRLDWSAILDAMGGESLLSVIRGSISGFAALRQRYGPVSTFLQTEEVCILFGSVLRAPRRFHRPLFSTAQYRRRVYTRCHRGVSRTADMCLAPPRNWNR